MANWSRLIPEREWSLYARVLDEALARRIPFALGGSFAVATYTSSWRDTKDMDLYVLPEHKENMIRALDGLGFADYFDIKGYDRWWIYRSTRDDTIVDVIWAMANHRQQIDELWMSGPEIALRGRRVKVLPPEALLWDKMYIMQRERCDWPDVFNLLYAVGTEVDWERLMRRLGDDAPLLAAALSIFRWLAAGRAERLPAWLWERVGLPSLAAEDGFPDFEKRRVELLDRRPWFGPERAPVEPAA